MAAPLGIVRSEIVLELCVNTLRLSDSRQLRRRVIRLAQTVWPPHLRGARRKMDRGVGRR